MWNEEDTSLEITILPPWWQTWWAWWVMYCYWGNNFLVYKFQLNHRLEQERGQKIREMDALKKPPLYHPHEFRTPLTVIIMGMTNELNDLIQHSAGNCFK
ncbi:MAG: hypothetical protein R3C61_27685 [Bacteroidia bacterium]